MNKENTKNGLRHCKPISTISEDLFYFKEIKQKSEETFKNSLNVMLYVAVVSKLGGLRNKVWEDLKESKL